MVTDDGSQARQLVVKRLRGALAGLERAGRQPNRREAYYFCQAMEHLQADRLPESEEALSNAQHVRPLPPDLAAKPEGNRPPTVQQLRRALDKLAAA